jgi:hypothetical protein
LAKSLFFEIIFICFLNSVTGPVLCKPARVSNSDTLFNSYFIIMAMLVLLDSNFRATFRFGSHQLLPVFSESIQYKVRGAPDRMSLVSQVSYFMRSSPPTSKVALIFGSFENMLTGRRSEIQHFPKAVICLEVESYAQMLQDLLTAHPSVSVFVFAPLF